MTRRKHHNPETDNLMTRTRFQGGNKNPDKEQLRSRGIKSPDIADMPFSVKDGKTIRFFSDEVKYRKFMKRRIV